MRVFMCLGGGRTGSQTLGVWLLELTFQAGHVPVVVTPDEDAIAHRCRELGIKVMVENWVVADARTFHVNRAIALSQLMKNEAPDLVLNHYIFPTRFLVRLAARRASVPVVTYVGTRQTWNSNLLIARLQRLLDVQSSKWSGITVAASAALQRALCEVGYEDVRLIPHGVSTSIPPLPPEFAQLFDRPVIACVGAIEEGKGQLLAVEAVAGLDARLLLVGGPQAGTYFESVVEKANELEVDLVSTGFVRNETARALAAQATALIHLPFSEGFGLSVAEGQAAGVPAVVSAVGGLPDIVTDGETGFVVPRESTALANERLSMILADGDLQLRMGGAARTRMESVFSLEKAEEHLLQTFVDATCSE
jgi:glycosyltransferase involved in cell wall biosynthesis